MQNPQTSDHLEEALKENEGQLLLVRERSETLADEYGANQYHYNNFTLGVIGKGGYSVEEGKIKIPLTKYSFINSFREGDDLCDENYKYEDEGKAYGPLEFDENNFIISIESEDIMLIVGNKASGDYFLERDLADVMAGLMGKEEWESRSKSYPKLEETAKKNIEQMQPPEAKNIKTYGKLLHKLGIKLPAHLQRYIDNPDKLREHINEDELVAG